MPTPIELIGGLAAPIGSDFRPSRNQLVFVEYGGKLSTYDLFPAATVVSQGTATLKGTFHFDFDAGVESTPGSGALPTWDVFWSQETAVIREMEPINTARLVNLGTLPFAAITATSLQPLPYATAAINGNPTPANKLVTGDIFAVKTTAGNFAKVLVVAYGYDIQLQWVTYKLAAAYNVIGTGYSLPEDVEIAADDTHAYVLEESGDLVKVALATVNRTAHTTTVIATGLVNPQQVALDEAHKTAYVVEFDPTGHGNLYRLSLTTPNAPKTSILNTLHGATGLVLSADLQYAYIAEQNAGDTTPTGTVARITLANGSRHLIAANLIAPFHLTWVDAGQTSLLVAERDPANRITRIDLAGTAATTNVIASGLAFRPSSVALASPTQLLVCTNDELQSVSLSPYTANAPLLMGVGVIPFDKILPTGLADTTVDPLLPLQVKNAPFGGTLLIMINHQQAGYDGAAFFRLLVYTNPTLTTLRLLDLSSVSDEHWNGTSYVNVTTAPVTLAGKPGFLPVHTLIDLAQWFTPTLGTFLDSTLLPNGLSTLIVEFVNAPGVPVGPTPTPLTILVDNNHCTGSLAQPTLGGATADTTCGLLHYTGKTPPQVVMPFTAAHPNNYATYSLTLIKGVNTLTPPSIGGPISAAASPITGTLPALLGSCTIAGFAEYLYVAATAVDGRYRQSAYDYTNAIAFVLAP